MPQIALLPCNIMNRGAYLESRELPTKYMEDYSLMGFVVDRYQQALHVLSSAGYKIEEQTFGADITVNSPGLIPEIRDLLATHDIRCDISDIADTIYQA